MLEIIPNLHPVFVHFTVALLSVSTGLFVMLCLFGRHLPEKLRNQLETVAYWNLWFGAGITIITVAAGFYAYNTVAHDGPSHAAMTDHRNWALATAPLFTVAALWSVVRLGSGKTLGGAFVILLLVAQLMLLSTAWRGGEVVYRYGLGVLSLPESAGEGDGHAHGGHSESEEPMDFSSMDEVMESDEHGH